MAGSSLFALIDDIATLLDDVALMSKVADKAFSGRRHRVVAQRVVGRSRNKGGPGAWAFGYRALHKVGKIASKQRPDKRPLQ